MLQCILLHFFHLPLNLPQGDPSNGSIFNEVLVRVFKKATKAAACTGLKSTPS
jgi:hypothetical protein